MRNTQKILYNIGKIINWVLLGVYALVFVLNLIFLIVDAVNEAPWNDNLSTMISMVVLLALLLVLIILVGKNEEAALKAPTHGLKPVILLMVFGILSGNLLFTVGGVFGIIAASQEANAKEEKKEKEVEEIK